jgi:hypothetical protein
MSENAPRVERQIEPLVESCSGAWVCSHPGGRALYLVATLSGYHSTQVRKNQLAVLPFQNFTGNPNKEYLADGLTEGTISQ